MTPPPGGRRKRLHGALSSRGAFVALALVAAALLGAGSVHGAGGTPARVAYLESIIKCPNCEDLTIAQSTSVPASHLRALVDRWVAEGRSNGWIEQQVVAHYGPSELLSPPVSGLDALAWVVPLAAVLAAAGGLAWFLLTRRRTATPGAPVPGDEELVSAAMRSAAPSAGGAGPADRSVDGGAGTRGAPAGRR